METMKSFLLLKISLPALIGKFRIKMLSFRHIFVYLLPVWSSLDPNLLNSRLIFFHHLISFVRFLWFQAFLGSHWMRKIRTIMTKTRKEGIRCVNRTISLLSSHFLLFVFLPAAVFTCRSQTRSPGQSSAQQQTGWLNEPNRCQQLNFWTSLMLFSVISFEFDVPTTCLTGRTCNVLFWTV